MLQLFKNSFIPGIIIYYDDDAYMCIWVRVCAFVCTCPQRLEASDRLPTEVCAGAHRAGGISYRLPTETGGWSYRWL